MPSLEPKPHRLPLVSIVAQWAGHKGTRLQNYPNSSLLALTGAFVAMRISVTSCHRAPLLAPNHYYMINTRQGNSRNAHISCKKTNNSNNQTNNAVKNEDKFIPQYNCTWHYTLECTLPCNYFSVHPSLLSLSGDLVLNMLKSNP